MRLIQLDLTKKSFTPIFLYWVGKNFTHYKSVKLNSKKHLFLTIQPCSTTKSQPGSKPLFIKALGSLDKEHSSVTVHIKKTPKHTVLSQAICELGLDANIQIFLKKILTLWRHLAVQVKNLRPLCAKPIEDCSNLIQFTFRIQWKTVNWKS